MCTTGSTFSQVTASEQHTDLCIPLAAVSAGHQSFAAVLRGVLRGVPPLDFGPALVLAVHRLMTAISLVLLEFDMIDVIKTCRSENQYLDNYINEFKE